MIALGCYLFTLAGSSALVGVYAHRVLADEGYVIGYEAGLYLTIGAATAYIAVQLAYIAAAGLFRPAKGAAFPLAESVSHLSSLLLLPYLRNVDIPWPHPVFEQAEALIYLGVFGLVHAFFKLVSFFAALQSEPAGRLRSVGWLAGCAASALAAYWAFGVWLAALEQARPRVAEAEAAYRIGDEYARARVMPEGSVLDHPLDAFPDACLTLRWARPPDADPAAQPDRIFVYAVMHGERTRTFSQAVRLRDTGWADFRVPPSALPERAHACSIHWTSEKEPFWQSLLGIRPIARQGARLLMSGPHAHVASADRSSPNVILIALEGLGASSMSRFGYKRAATPSLDQFSQTALTFDHAFAPAPEVSAACMTLLTGSNPLEHGFLGRHAGPLPHHIQTLAEALAYKRYATVAFTEGDARRDLVSNLGFERGFEIFDPSYRMDKPVLSPSGEAAAAPPLELEEEPPDAARDEPPSAPSTRSRATIEKARAWIDRNADVRFMLFMRLRELADLEWHEYYGAVSTGAADPLRPRDRYDGALAYLDRQLGAFLKHLRDSELRNNTVIIVTSPYGLDFGAGTAASPRAGLTDESLRVPVVIYAPWIPKAARQDLIALEDVAPAIAGLAGVKLQSRRDAPDFFAGPINSLPISVFGDPLTLSVRSPKWRLIWETGRRAFDTHRIEPAQPPRLYDVGRAARQGFITDEAARNPETVSRWRARIEELLKTHDELWNVPGVSP